MLPATVRNGRLVSIHGGRPEWEPRVKEAIGKHPQSGNEKHLIHDKLFSHLLNFWAVDSTQTTSPHHRGILNIFRLTVSHPI